MNHTPGSKKRARQPRPDGKKRWQIEATEIELLNQRVMDESPASGARTREGVEHPPRSFDEMPLSQATMAGLKRGGFTKKITHIQQYAIPHALAGRDILGAAKTGSG